MVSSRAATSFTIGCDSRSRWRGVAFAVTLVLLQVRLFMGLLDKATTIDRNTPRRHLGDLAQHPQRRLRPHVPGDLVLRVRGVPGSSAGQPDRPVHEPALPSGAEEGTSSMPSTISRVESPWSCRRQRR